LAFVAQPAACGFGAAGVECYAAFLDVDDFAFFVDYESGPVSHSRLGYQHTVSRRYLPFGEIAQQREGGIHLGGEFLLGGGVVCADSKNLSFCRVEFCNTSLVCEQFARSTTGESRGEESQHYVVLSPKIG
jgi:hypothetical protein